MKKPLASKKGIVLILTFIIMTVLTIITLAFLYMISGQARASGYDMDSSKALWLAEAGMQKAVWNLKTPVSGGGQGENWVTAGTTESLGSGSYTMKTERWDWALASNGASAAASSSASGRTPDLAVDNNDATYWQSASKPVPGSPQYITVTFPYALTINRVRFFVPSGSSQQAPKDYDWQVSTDGITYTNAKSVNGSTATDVTNEFTAAANVNYLRLNVSKIDGGSVGCIIAALEAVGSKITSTGSSGAVSRQAVRTAAVHDGVVVVADGNSTVYNQIDWDEIVPAV
ncbi:MAG: discoidin domain-containing protein [Candidatus Omnitrophota bacterium]|nr:discoidin domain-containing protein [Candidatus Omnitrophota bacterium]